MKTNAAYPVHSEYKASGYAWVGDLPAHWTIEKLGTCLSAVSSKGRPDLPLLSITREAGVIERDVDDQESNHNFIPEDLSNYKVLRAGQFGMNKMKAWQGSYGISSHTGIVSPAYFVFDITREVDPAFFNLALRSRLYVSYFAAASDGVRIGQWDLSKTRMREIPVLLPPVAEQRAIAEYLEEKCVKVDEAVRIKEGQIALLRERRQIIIQHAVNRGLNPSAPMKDSGVDWIGMIPAHWEVRRSKYLFEQRKELARQGDTQLSATQSHGVIPQEEFEDIVGRRVVKIQTNLEKRKHVEVDDFVISMRSFQGGLERAFATGCIRSSYVILRPLEVVNADFFGYLFKSPRYIKALQATGSFIRDGQDLNFENFSKVDLFIPPLEEQAAISAHIREACRKIDNGIDIKQEQIAALKEYKRCLTNAAVTGKIKVT